MLHLTTGRSRQLRWLSALALTAVLAGCTPAAPAPPATPSSPVVTGSPSVTPSPSPTPSATPPATPLTPQEQYCVDYRTILAVEADPTTDDETMDVAKLSAWAGETIRKYQAAAKNAPSGIAGDYRKVIQYLKDFKVTIDSGDQEAIIAQVRYLPKLNSAMEAIRKASEKLCG